MWVGLVRSVEGRKRKDGRPRRGRDSASSCNGAGPLGPHPADLGVRLPVMGADSLKRASPKTPAGTRPTGCVSGERPSMWLSAPCLPRYLPETSMELTPPRGRAVDRGPPAYGPEPTHYSKYLVAAAAALPAAAAPQKHGAEPAPRHLRLTARRRRRRNRPSPRPPLAFVSSRVLRPVSGLPLSNFLLLTCFCSRLKPVGGGRNKPPSAFLILASLGPGFIQNVDLQNAGAGPGDAFAFHVLLPEENQCKFLKAYFLSKLDY